MASAASGGGRTPVAYRVVTPTSEQWLELAAEADAVAADALGVTLADIEPLRRRVTVDPVVVRHDGARWRSRQVWSVRSGESAVRVFEMLRIDEALYDH
jgi:hypothetical protein